MMEEIWKDIKGYEGRYQVSNLGRVRSLDRYTKQVGLHGCKFERFRRGTIIKQGPNKRGYLTVGLYDASVHKQRRFYVHRLVAMAFVQGYKEGTEVNHMDEDVTNNRADNLEWITQRENLNYGTRGYRVNKNRFVGVEQFDTDGKRISTYESLADAERQTGVFRHSIVLCCQGKTKTGGGYRWRYAED